MVTGQGKMHDPLPVIAARHRSADDALAQYARQMAPDSRPPTCQDLVEWLRACPENTISETSSRLSDDLDQEVLRIAVTSAGVLIIETSAGESAIPITDLADRHGPDAREFCLAPLIWAWLHRYAVPECRPDRILPEPIRHARVTQAALPMAAGDGLPRLGRQDLHQAFLSGMEPPPAAVVPTLPLPVAMESTAGQGAPIASRLWFGFQMALPMELRTGESVTLRFTLREVRDWLWPHGWRRGVHLPMLQKGLRDLYRLGIIYDRAEWLLVRPVILPTGDTRLDDDLLVDVTALPGSDHGPMVDTVRLWRLGVMSAVAWRAWIRLAYLWDDAKRRNGGYRIYAARPEVRRGQDGVILDARGQPVLTRGGLPIKNWARPPRDSHPAAGTAPTGRPGAGPGNPRSCSPRFRRFTRAGRHTPRTVINDAPVASADGEPGGRRPGMGWGGSPRLGALSGSIPRRLTRTCISPDTSLHNS